MGFKDSRLFRAAAKRAFKECDADASGRLDYKEVIIGLLKLYDRLNAQLPAHVPAPSRRAMFELCQRFDVDGDGFIDQAEFLELAKVLIGTRTAWRDSLVWVMFSTLALNLVIYPLLAGLVVAGVKAQTDEGVSLPPAPVAAALGLLLPWLLRRQER